MDSENLPIVEVVSEGDSAIRPGQTSAFFKIEFEEAKEADQWVGIYHDLWFVVHTIEQILTIKQRKKPNHNTRKTVDEDDILMYGLWSATLIAYRRCFNTGVRGGFDEDVFGDREDVLKQHRYYVHIRGKHIAHSVNPFEMSATGIGVINLEGESPRVHSAVTMHATRVMEDASIIKYLGELAAWLQAIARERHGEVLREVLHKAQLLTKEELHHLKPLQETPRQGYEVAGESRPSNQHKEAKKKRDKKTGKGKQN